MLAEITWYVLPKLKQFIEDLKEYRQVANELIYLIHLLTTYAKDTQKYGKEYFSDLDEILGFFDLNDIEYGFVVVDKDYDSDIRDTYFRGTYFVARL